MKVAAERIRSLNTREFAAGPIVYWMQRDQRVHDNWALLYAQQLALERKQPLCVVFNVVPTFLQATIRQYGFMLKGLQEVEGELEKKHIAFTVLSGDPTQTIPAFIGKHHIGTVITDFSPLHTVRRWKEQLAKRVTIPMLEVDAHNIVPVWAASPKQEFGAYTIRPKIHKLLPRFLEPFPILKKHPFSFKKKFAIDWKKIDRSLEVNRSVTEVEWIVPGERAANRAFKQFIKARFKKYATERNDPTKEAQSELSPYLHFGQISAQRIALEVSALPASESKKSFLEELIVRRELSDNFCFYNPHYDAVAGFPAWAKKTLDEHRGDERAIMYSFKQLEHAQTHDPLWNAAQLEMVHRGKMHHYMRMYWAKKILEWTPNPETALRYAIQLNDTYELDGRDPNGYVGCAWSIGGVHDRAWGERPIFGKIRYMSYNGAKGKFAVQEYIDAMAKLSGQTVV